MDSSTPIRTVLPAELADAFELDAITGDGMIHAYRHRDTGQMLHVDALGRTYALAPRGGLVIVARGDALRSAFAGSGLLAS